MIDGIVWAEVYRMKSDERYLDLYLDKIKCRRKWATILSLAFSTGGLLGSMWLDYAPLIGVAATAVTQVVSFIQEHVIMSDSEMAKVMDLRIQCIYAFDKFEKLYLKLWYKKLTEDDAINEFYDIRTEFTEIQKLFNVLHLPPCNKIATKAGKQTLKYLADHFNLSDEVVEESLKASKVHSS